MKLRVAISQFPVTADVRRNLAYVRRHVAAGVRARARVVLFPEGALSGYAGIDFASQRDFDWERLEQALDEVVLAARRARLWVVVGTQVRSGGRGRPFNSLIAIDPTGALATRYDKRLLAGPPGESDTAHFRPGSDPVVVAIDGVPCGFAICHEWRYPEVYRQYKALGARLVLQSWYDGGYDARGWRSEGALLREVIPATVRGHAVCNHLWICGSNTSRRASSFGGFVVRPDGRFLARQPRHRPGILVRTLDLGTALPDPAAHLRPRVMRGLL